MSILSAEVDHTSSSPLLVAAALLGIAAVVVLITVLKVHPFLALILGSAVLGVVAGVSVKDIVSSFTTGVGSTVGSVGLLIALGAMIGGLLTASGGADEVVRRIVDRVSPRALPWAMGGVAALIGIPLFFEIGVVLLIPIVLLVAHRSNQPVLRVGIPALAGLSVLHGFIPPHPGPLVAISSLHASLGLVLLFGLILAIPCVILAGPVFGSLISRRLPVATPPVLVGAAVGGRETGTTGTGASDGADRDLGDTGDRSRPAEGARRQPGLGPTVATVLLPVVLMLLGAIGELTLDEGTTLRNVSNILGTPVIALLIGVIVAMFTLGTAVGFGRQKISDTVGGPLPAIAGILLIVAAGGGFKQLLVDSGISGFIVDAAEVAAL